MISVKCNYEIYNKELLTIVQIFEKWHSELKDFKYSVQMLSDHKNLKYFKTFKLLNCWQTHWSEYLFRFDFKIVYCSDKLNSTADILSCQSEDFSSKEENKIMLQQILKSENFEISDLDLQTSTISNHNSHTFSLKNLKISVSDTDKEDSELKNQFMKTYINNEEYQKVKVTLKADHLCCIREFLFTEAELINEQIYYWDKHKLMSKDNALHLWII